eukprot:scaffold356419_cov20-Prasinocladus_malaysianus.AAC.1
MCVALADIASKHAQEESTKLLRVIHGGNGLNAFGNSRLHEPNHCHATPYNQLKKCSDPEIVEIVIQL